jgi:PPP family 3-phenylpropionic acid transporter
MSPVNNFRLLYLMVFACGTAWLPFFSFYLKENEMTGAQIGYISSLVWIVQLLFQPLWGVFADRYGRILCFRFAVVTSTIALLCFAFFATSLLSIVICTLVYSFCSMSIIPLLDTLVLEYVDTTSKLSYSHLRFWGAVGAAGGAQLSGLMISPDHAYYIFIAAAMPMFLSIPLVFRLKAGLNREGSIKMEFKDLRSVLSNKFLIIFLSVIFITGIGQTSIWFYLTVYIHDLGGSEQLSATAQSVQGLSELPFYFITALLFRRIGLRNTLLVAFFGTVIRLYLYSVNFTPMNVLFIEASNGISWTLFWVASVEYVNRMVKPQWRATGQSLLWAVYFGAGQITGNILTGHLYEKMSMNKVFAVNGVIALVAMAIAALTFFIWRDNTSNNYQHKAIESSTNMNK